MSNPVPVPPDLNFVDTLTPFNFFSNRVLASVYGDEISYYEVLTKTVSYLNETMSNVNEINNNTSELYAYVVELYELLEKFIESGFDDYYSDQVIKWIDSHLTWIFNTVVRQVYFGLTQEGNFVAYIPDGWNDIIFDTGVVYGLETYGRLILKWDADSPYNVKQNT